MKKMLKSALLGSLVGLSALALAACGNSDSTGTSADKTVKVGILQYMEHDFRCRVRRCGQVNPDSV